MCSAVGSALTELPHFMESQTRWSRTFKQKHQNSFGGSTLGMSTDGANSWDVGSQMVLKGTLSYNGVGYGCMGDLRGSYIQ